MTTLLLRRRPLAAGPPRPTTGLRARPAGRAGSWHPLRLVRGAETDPAWVRPGLLAVLALAAVLCLWNLTGNGYSNEYYAAAAKSASVSWKAWFFGSLDPGSFITVDKPPLSIWLMGLSARVFGFSSFSILLPQALCTVAAVGGLSALVRRAFGPAAGLAAAVALALTPVTVAIGRVNNPDALLVLLMVAAAALTLRAVESGRTKHLVWAGVLVGLAFMTKMLQGWMILPALAATYLVAGPVPLLHRARQVALAGAATLATSAAWPVAVSLWPGSTPYIGGSTDGSVWNLILGYNGLGRITGDEDATGGSGPTFGGLPGALRLFNDTVGGQVAWLVPFAALSLVAGLWATRGRPRTDIARAGWILLGVWAAVHVVIFSTAKGIFHPYYVSALAPAVAALAGAGLVSAVASARRSWVSWAVLAAGLSGSAWLAVELLGRASDYAGWLRLAVPAAAAVAVLAGLGLRLGGSRRLLAVAAVAGAFALLAGPASWSVASVGRSLSGNNVIAGPASAAQTGGGGGAGGGGARPGGSSGTRPALPAGAGAAPSGSASAGNASAATTSAAAGAAGGEGGAGLSSAAIRYLQAHQNSAKYLVAASGSQTTAGVIIATGEPVVTIGGFGGSDPAPTVAQLAQMVRDGELKYVLVGSGRGGSSALTAWVKAHGTAVTAVSVSSGTLYAVTA